MARHIDMMHQLEAEIDEATGFFELYNSYELLVAFDAECAKAMVQAKCEFDEFVVESLCNDVARKYEKKLKTFLN